MFYLRCIKFYISLIIINLKQVFVASPGIEPGSGASETLILSIVRRGPYYLIKPCAFVANIFTAMASNITPKNFLMIANPFGPKARSSHLSEIKTR